MRYLLPLFLLLAGCTTSSPDNTQALAEAKKTAEEATRRAEAAEKKLAEVTPAPAAPAPKAALPDTPRPTVINVPAGTPIAVRTTTLISSKTAQVGDTFVAHLEQPLLAGGAMVAPKGAEATLRVTSVDPGGRVKGRATIALALASFIDSSGKQQAVRTGAWQNEAKSGVKKDVLKTGIASGIGAAVGAIAGGGKGAAIGAGAGAAGGTGVVLATRGPAAEVAPESVLRFTLAQPLKLTR